MEENKTISERVQKGSLCENCRILSFTLRSLIDEQDSIMILGYNRQDTYPNLPALEASGQTCPFCCIMREAILADLPYWLESTQTTASRLEIRTTRIRFFIGPADWNYEDEKRGLRAFSVDVGWRDLDHADQDEEVPGQFEIQFDLVADKDDAAVDIFDIWRRPIGNESFSEANQDLLREWIGTCTNEHKRCRGDVPVPLPTRLVSIGRDDSEVMLVETKGSEGKYLALSYQWGEPDEDHPLLKTTNTNREAHLECITQDVIPPAFKDVFKVARLLAIEYVWIDSLCIIQDDASDWREEAFKMAKYYGNAFLTVAAASISSPKESFLHSSRKLWPMARIPVNREGIAIEMNAYEERHKAKTKDYPEQASSEIEPSDTQGEAQPSTEEWLQKAHCFYVYPLRVAESKYNCIDEFVGDVGSTSWNKRGWTFQERKLSSRILYFGKTQMHFECLEARYSEQEPWQNALRRLGQETDGEDKVAMEAIDSESQAEELFKSWYRWISDYTRRDLTYASDRLPAIAGIAEKLMQKLPSTPVEEYPNYFYGTWKQDLIRSLLWRSTNTGNKPMEVEETLTMWASRESIAPTWSWPSHHAEVEWRLNNSYVPACKFLSVSLRGLLQGRTPAEAHDFITLKGKLLRIKAPPKRDVRFSGQTDYHNEAIILKHIQQGKPSHLDLTYDGKRFGNAIFDKRITFPDGIWMEMAPAELESQGRDLFVFLLGWEIHKMTEDSEYEVNDDAASTSASVTDGQDGQDLQMVEPSKEFVEELEELSLTETESASQDFDANPQDYGYEDGQYYQMPNDFERLGIRVGPDDPIVEEPLFDNATKPKHSTEKPGVTENWPVGLLLTSLLPPEVPNPDIFRRVGIFERITEENVEEAQAVFQNLEEVEIGII